VSARPVHRLPFPAAGRVVKACFQLGDELKLAWLEHVALDGREGAYIGAGQLGQRLGKGPEAIKRARRELIRLGLLISGNRAPGKTGTYYPALPTGCIPSVRPAVAEVARLAERLDEHVRGIRSGGVHAPSLAPPGGHAPLLGALVPLESRTDAPSLEAPAPPPSDRERAQTGGAAAPANSSREEVGRRGGSSSTPPSPSEGGEPQTSHHREGGDSALSRRGKAEERQPREAASQADRKAAADPVPVGEVVRSFVDLLPAEARADFLRYKESLKGALPAEEDTP
jgi:hypothetical protein